MLNFLPAPLLGFIGGSLLLLNIIIMPLLIVTIGTIRYLIPIPSWRDKISYCLHEQIPSWWVSNTNFIIWLTLKIEWDIQGTDQLNRRGWYFMMCNHQTWLDIILLEKIFQYKVPMLKFFLKKQLLWMLPVGGLACWMMDFPFLERYSKSYLKKHPEKKGKDLEATRRACEKFKRQPITVINFLEGTRFTPEKHRNQASPYKHLLKAKAGAFAFVLSAMNEHINEVIDVTIIYPKPGISLWQFVSGRVKKIIIRYEVITLDLPTETDFYENRELRSEFQAWVNERWQKKDQLIDDALRANK